MQEPSADTCEPASELNKPPCIKQHHHHHRSHHHHHGSIAAQVVGKQRVVHSHGLLSRYGCIAVGSLLSPWFALTERWGIKSKPQQPGWFMLRLTKNACDHAGI